VVVPLAPPPAQGEKEDQKIVKAYGEGVSWSNGNTHSAIRDADWDFPYFPEFSRVSDLYSEFKYF